MVQGATSEEITIIDSLINQGRTAMSEIANADQARIDEIVTAVAWSLYKPENAQRLAEMAVADTGIGNVKDKVIKNQRKTFGTLRDLMRAKTVGIIDSDPASGMVKYGKPVGVVAAITPSTNPAATPVNKTMMALKGANATVIAASPAGWKSTNATVELMREALTRIGIPRDLVQTLPHPVSRNMALNRLPLGRRCRPQLWMLPVVVWDRKTRAAVPPAFCSPQALPRNTSL